MDQLTNNKHKIDLGIIKPKLKRKEAYKKCNECNKKRKPSIENHQICRVCYRFNTQCKQSGNKIIDDFIRYTQTNYVSETRGRKMKFVPYDQFKDVEFIAEGGFSKIYKATWIDSTVVLKELNNSKDVTSKELNELKIFYDVSIRVDWFYMRRISGYFGITQGPTTQNIMIIMPYYEAGDLKHYISNYFYNISWEQKLSNLISIIMGLHSIHCAEIVHRDLHSGNIFFNGRSVPGVYSNAVIGDLGISKSATESTDDNNHDVYGIIPYMAPEILQGKKYTTASDIYSFGMIMWEFMTGRRPFWDKVHDIELIIEICDGLRPPIVTNAPVDYINLMEACWNFDPKKRPIANVSLAEKIYKMRGAETFKKTEITRTPDIGPVTINNPGAIYKSRSLSNMVKSAISLRNSKSQFINLGFAPPYYYQSNNIDKRKFEDNLIDDNGQLIKKRKLFENENDEYITKEVEFDI